MNHNISPSRSAPARRPVLTADRELALLRGLIEAASRGPGVEPLAAAAARMITDATATDVCFVHVLDDTERSLTLTGATWQLIGMLGLGLFVVVELEKLIRRLLLRGTTAP